MYHYLLCINVRPQNVADFAKISARISRLAPEIGVLGRPGDYHESMIPPELVHVPRLTIYLVNPPAVPDSRGHILTVAQIDKYQQYLNYVKGGVRTPRTIIYNPSDPIDPKEWGKHVILKPRDGSYGRGVLLVPTAELNKPEAALRLTEYISQKSYILQERIDTTLLIETFRVVVFLGEPLLSYSAKRKAPFKLPTTLSESIDAEIFAVGDKERLLLRDPEILEFARKAYLAHSTQPLQGLDLCRDARSGQVYVIENNAGGNVWAFSREAALIYKQYGPQPLIDQFRAWVVSADVLIRKTRELAC